MIRLSHSTLETFHTCERKFQLERIYDAGREDLSPHLSGGTIFGIGGASYLQHQDADRAIYEAYMAWNEDSPETDTRNWKVYLNALWRVFPSLDLLLDEWEVVSFQGKPAVELSFRINIDEVFYYVGYMDVVIKNKYSGVYAVLDFKHTGLSLKDISPLYKFSGQLIGYSIVLDKIVGENLASYEVHYFSAQLGRNPYEVTPHHFAFKKTLLDRLNWFASIQLDVQQIHQMKEINIFPRRGSSCMKYNKPCFHFNTCALNSLDNLPLREDNHEMEYDFTYNLEELIADHIERTQHL